ncbi:hypothetical protein NQ317_017761 [Molorchus minor]|uniref:Uncharacterized protein n=1 Tax=Molorchus minor TaxID=1323400 RepID=A0ABQ9JIV3_9CUCU|nr:hypothetical protein NQ317_017761 [Molorchus minor]
MMFGHSLTTLIIRLDNFNQGYLCPKEVPQSFFAGEILLFRIEDTVTVRGSVTWSHSSHQYGSTEQFGIPNLVTRFIPQAGLAMNGP